MRQIAAGLFISLDGVVEAPGNWGFQYMDTEMAKAISAGIAQADTVLLGRKTYMEFSQLWPGQGSEVPMSDFLNHSPKFVVSSTITELPWQPATLVTGDLPQALFKLKQQPGGTIQVPGSPTLVRFLIQNGLLDVLSLTICPVVVGCGMRLFDDMDISFKLKLVHSTALSTGAIGATYAPVSESSQPVPPISFPSAAAPK